MKKISSLLIGFGAIFTSCFNLISCAKQNYESYVTKWNKISTSEFEKKVYTICDHNSLINQKDISLMQQWISNGYYSYYFLNDSDLSNDSSTDQKLFEEFLINILCNCYGTSNLSKENVEIVNKLTETQKNFINVFYNHFASDETYYFVKYCIKEKNLSFNQKLKYTNYKVFDFNPYIWELSYSLIKTDINNLYTNLNCFKRMKEFYDLK